MKKIKLTLVAASLLAGIATTASAQMYGDTANVLSATPIKERVAVPKRECLVEPSRYEAPPEPVIRSEGSGTTGAGAVLGALIGGVIGHQFGSSSGGHDHGTAAGAVIGGLIGNSIEKDQNTGGYQRAANEVPAQRPVPPGCETVTEMGERVVGYDVRYEYNGHEFRTRMPYDPGPQMPVNVEVRPPMPPMPRDAAVGPRTPNYRGTY